MRKKYSTMIVSGILVLVIAFVLIDFMKSARIVVVYQLSFLPIFLIISLAVILLFVLKKTIWK